MKQTDVKVIIMHVDITSNEKLFHSKLKPLFKTTSKFNNFLTSLILTLLFMMDHIQIVSFQQIENNLVLMHNVKHVCKRSSRFPDLCGKSRWFLGCRFPLRCAPDLRRHQTTRCMSCCLQRTLRSSPLILPLPRHYQPPGPHLLQLPGSCPIPVKHNKSGITCNNGQNDIVSVIKPSNCMCIKYNYVYNN